MSRDSRRLAKLISSINIQRGHEYKVTVNEAILLDKLVHQYYINPIMNIINRLSGKGKITASSIRMDGLNSAIRPDYDPNIWINPENPNAPLFTNIMVYQRIITSFVIDDYSISELIKLMDMTTSRYPFEEIDDAIKISQQSGVRSISYLYEIARGRRMNVEADMIGLRIKINKENSNNKFYEPVQFNKHDTESINESKRRFEELIQNASLITKARDRR